MIVTPLARRPTFQCLSSAISRSGPPLHPRPCLHTKPFHNPARAFSSSIPNLNSSTKREESKVIAQKGQEAKANPKWLAEIKQRIGKCIIFGMNASQCSRAGDILSVIARDWRELVAGSEGFLTSRERAGLQGHAVVWGEMDSMGHVNNVTYVRYAESARINWAANIARFVDPGHGREWSELWTPRGEGLILRSIRTDYKFPMKWPDRISVYHKLREPPSHETDSFILDVVILSDKHQRPAARCVEDIVVYDYKKGKKAPLRPFMADVFMDTFKLQEEAKERNSRRIAELLDSVTALEKETWGRADAKEDFGSAKA